MNAKQVALRAFSVLGISLLVTLPWAPHPSVALPASTVTASDDAFNASLEKLYPGSSSSRETDPSASDNSSIKKYKDSDETTGSDEPYIFAVHVCVDESTLAIDSECVELAESMMCGGEDRHPLKRLQLVDGKVSPVSGFNLFCGSLDELENPLSPTEDTSPADRPDLVAKEFTRLAIPKPVVRFQDEIADQVVDGRTWGAAMRGENVNMWAEAGDHTLTTTLLGVEVTIRATPLEYTWDYGNGDSRTTAYAGGRTVPSRTGAETATSNAYEDTGFYPVTVTTAYAGQFKTPTSDWIPIPGVATVTSPAKTATVWKNETRLVSGDCSENPGSWGCETVLFPWEGGPQTSEAFKAAQEELEARQ